VLLASVLLSRTFSQDPEISPTLATPEFTASLSIGFNYDFNRIPTDVSFDYPLGYFGLNVPLKMGLDKTMAQSFIDTSMFPDGKEFEPDATARQYANYTVRVDVPVWGGVASWSNLQNMYMNYSNTLGEPSVHMGFNDPNIDFFMRGMVAVPLDLSFGWETMTFGYAYKVNDLLKVAVNLHRHIFHLDMRANIDVDLLGYFDLHPEIPENTGGTDDLPIDLGEALSDLERRYLKYSSDDVYGQAEGHYRLETWSPTFGIQFWRLGVTSRFGIRSQADGSIYGRYSLPFFIDPESFTMDDLGDEQYLLDNINRLESSDVDSIRYQSDDKLKWNMPTAHTLTFDIIPEHLRVSYTKLFGDVHVRLDNIEAVRTPINTRSDEGEVVREITFDASVTVDNVLLLHGSLKNAFINAGIFGIDASFMEKTDLLELGLADVWPIYGGGALMPVLTFGTTVGAKIKLLLEVDVLPLTALKSGIQYYF
jgi:hypothetical protein